MSKSFRVAQIVQHLAPGGIETMVLDLQAAAREPENVYIIALEGVKNSVIRKWPRLASVPRIYCLNKASGISVPTVKKLSDLLRSLQIDVIHTHHVGPFIYGGTAAKLVGCRHVHTEHDAWHLINLKRRMLVTLFLHMLRPIVVADAKLVAKNIRRYIPFASPEVITNGIDTSRFIPGDQGIARQLLKLPDHVKIIGCAARLTPVKAHDLLIRALSKLPSDSHLALAGDGPLADSLKSLARDLNLLDRIHFLGVVDNMPAFFQAIDIFCLSSTKEGLPLSPLEAQSCMRNVVLTDVGGCSEAAAPGGIVVPSCDEKALSQALQQQLDSGCSDETRRVAREFVEEHGNLNKMVDQYTRLYKKDLG